MAPSHDGLHFLTRISSQSEINGGIFTLPVFLFAVFILMEHAISRSHRRIFEVATNAVFIWWFVIGLRMGTRCMHYRFICLEACVPPEFPATFCGPCKRNGFPVCSPEHQSLSFLHEVNLVPASPHIVTFRLLSWIITGSLERENN